MAAAEAARPDFIGAWHVCGKVPDQILDRFFSNVLGLMHEGTQVFLQFEHSASRKQLHGLAWTLPEEMMINAVKHVDPGLKIEIQQISDDRRRDIRYQYAHVHY